jgi:hypothetical protein
MSLDVSFDKFKRTRGQFKLDDDEQKILEYLCQCFKDNVSPDLEYLYAEKFSIDERVWPSIIMGLLDNGYISGVVTDRDDKRNYPNGYVQFLPEITITRKGIKYLNGTV